MDEERMKKEVARSRRVILITFVLVLLLVLVLAAFYLRAFVFQDSNSMLSTESLSRTLSARDGKIYVKCGDKAYLLDTGPALASLLDMESWSDAAKAEPVGDEWITLRLGENYELYVFDDAFVGVYDGYAGRFQEAGTYYALETSLYETLATYIAKNGEAVAVSSSQFLQ